MGIELKPNEVALLARRRAAMTVNEWAEQAGVSSGVVRDVEAGRLRCEALDKAVADAIGCRVPSEHMLPPDAGEEALVYRLRAGLTLKQSAVTAGVSVPAVYSWEASDGPAAIRHRDTMRKAAGKRARERA